MTELHAAGTAGSIWGASVAFLFFFLLCAFPLSLFLRALTSHSKRQECKEGY